MRVLHVINSLAPGGAERLLSDLLPRLVSRGIECSILVLDARNDAFSRELAAGGVKVRFAREGRASPYSPARLIDVARAIRAEKPDIVHAHLAPSFHWCALASLRARGATFMATEHAIANRRMSMPLARGVERWCYGRYRLVACVSEEAARSLRDWLGLSADALPIVPNGVDVGRFAAGSAPDAELAAWAGTRRLVVMTARFVPAKDHGTALRALSLLPEDYAMAFIGEGPLRPGIEEEARRLGIAGRCLFLGARNDVPAILARADAYLQSSREEGFGIACLEAMAAGVPVASSDAGGLAPLVSGAGRLFSVGDASACAGAIRSLCEEPEARISAIEAGRRRAAGHSMDRAAETYADIYSSARGAR